MVCPGHHDDGLTLSLSYGMRSSSIGRIPKDEEYLRAVKVCANGAMTNMMILTFAVTVEKTHISRTQQKRE